MVVPRHKDRMIYVHQRFFLDKFAVFLSEIINVKADIIINSEKHLHFDRDNN